MYIVQKCTVLEINLCNNLLCLYFFLQVFLEILPEVQPELSEECGQSPGHAPVPGNPRDMRRFQVKTSNLHFTIGAVDLYVKKYRLRIRMYCLTRGNFSNFEFGCKNIQILNEFSKKTIYYLNKNGWRS